MRIVIRLLSLGEREKRREREGGRGGEREREGETRKERDRGREGERERKGENKGEAERELGRECEGDDDFLFLLPVLFMFF